MAVMSPEELHTHGLPGCSESAIGRAGPGENDHAGHPLLDLLQVAKDFEGFLDKLAVGADEFCKNADRSHEAGGKEKDQAEKKRLDVAAGVTDKEKVEKSRERHGRDQHQNGGCRQKDLEGLMSSVHTDHRRRGTPNEGEHGFEQSRLTEFLVGSDWDGNNGHFLATCLDERFEGVGKGADDVQLESGLSGNGTETAGGIGNVETRKPPDHEAPVLLEELFHAREVPNGLGLPIADNDVGLPTEDRLHQFRDVLTAVLVVGVGVHDDVGTKGEGGVEPQGEGPGKPPILGETGDVVDATLAGDLGSAVGAPIVDDERFNPVNTGDDVRKVGKSVGEGLFLVVAGYLDDELHRLPLSLALGALSPAASGRVGALQVPETHIRSESTTACYDIFFLISRLFSMIDSRVPPGFPVSPQPVVSSSRQGTFLTKGR